MAGPTMKQCSTNETAFAWQYASALQRQAGGAVSMQSMFDCQSSGEGAGQRLTFFLANGPDGPQRYLLSKDSYSGPYRLFACDAAGAAQCLNASLDAPPPKEEDDMGAGEIIFCALSLGILCMTGCRFEADFGPGVRPLDMNTMVYDIPSDAPDAYDSKETAGDPGAEKDDTTFDIPEVFSDIPDKEDIPGEDAPDAADIVPGDEGVVVPPDEDTDNPLDVPEEVFPDAADAEEAGPDTPSCIPQEESCNGLDDDCDGTTDDVEGLGEECSTEDLGVCKAQGSMTCDPTHDPAVFCKTDAPAEPKAEECNGLDDSCDGTTDEGFPDLDQDGLANCVDGDDDNDGFIDDLDNCPIVFNPGQEDANGNGLGDACDGDYDGDGVLDEFDNCVDVVNTGQEDNDADGIGDACDQEECDEIDHDGDGDPYNGFDVGDPCTAGVGACAADGQKVCADLATTICNATPGEPSSEECNGVDDDCDGKIDENVEGNLLQQPCGITEGVCIAGLQICAGGGWSECMGEVTGLDHELCNGKDDDCDGTTDEDFTSLGSPCTAGAGICFAEGTVACKPDGTGVACGAVPGPSKNELCNGLDDDCDGGTDEDFQKKGEPCTSGKGVCETPGKFVCSDDKTFLACDAVPGPKGTEGCNGLDDDCNGTTDDVAGVGTSCMTGGLGVCNTGGKLTCDPAISAELFCEAAVPVTPKEEECNGLDDSCDGATDEGFLDTDGDGQADCVDVDDDEDGVFDVVDNCPVNVNPGQEDFNDNAVGDVCEDSDGDGVLDAADNCKATLNPTQANSYGTAAGDACEDSDADSVMDDVDNCPIVPNPGQSDLDKDGIGDDCDTTPCDATAMGWKKLFTYVSCPPGTPPEQCETAQHACATTPPMYLASLNGGAVTDAGFNIFLDKTKGPVEVALASPACLATPQSFSLQPNLATWDQGVTMVWQPAAGNAPFCFSALKMKGTENNSKAMFYAYSANADGSCNTASSAQEYGYPLYSATLLTNCAQ